MPNHYDFEGRVALVEFRFSPLRVPVRLHLAQGFERVGTFVGVGTKFGRLWDVTWYQRPLGARR